MAAHRKSASARKRPRDPRPSAALRGYGYGWRKYRANRLSARTRCRRCGVRSGLRSHLHHGKGGIRPLCRSCHNSTSAKRR